MVAVMELDDETVELVELEERYTPPPWQPATVHLFELISQSCIVMLVVLLPVPDCTYKPPPCRTHYEEGLMYMASRTAEAAIKVDVLTFELALFELTLQLLNAMLLTET